MGRLAILSCTHASGQQATITSRAEAQATGNLREREPTLKANGYGILMCCEATIASLSGLRRLNSRFTSTENLDPDKALLTG
jgi:hypothetical protein